MSLLSGKVALITGARAESAQRSLDYSRNRAQKWPSMEETRPLY